VMSPGVAVVAMLAGGFKPVPQSRRHRLARYSHIDGDGVYGDDVQLREPTRRKTRKLRRSFRTGNCILPSIERKFIKLWANEFQDEARNRNSSAYQRTCFSGRYFGCSLR
jgi:hypothetical protein